MPCRLALLVNAYISRGGIATVAIIEADVVRVPVVNAQPAVGAVVSVGLTIPARDKQTQHAGRRRG